MLNYIIQLNTFENLCIGTLPMKAQIIYYKLFKWSNRYGLGEPFQLSNSILMLETGITNEKTFIDNRNLLKQKGFISFEPGKKGKPTKYTYNLQVKTEVKTEVNSTAKTTVNPTVNVTGNNGAIKDTTLSNNNILNINNLNKTKQGKNPKEHDYVVKEKAGGGFSQEALELAKLWEQRFGMVSSYRMQNIQDLVDEYGKDIAGYAIKEAHQAANSNWPYIKAIARNESMRRQQENKTGSVYPRGRPAGNAKNDAQAGMQRALEILEGDEE